MNYHIYGYLFILLTYVLVALLAYSYALRYRAKHRRCYCNWCTRNRNW
jgi:hypothetical protein